MVLAVACSEGGSAQIPPTLLHDRALVTSEDISLVIDVGATADDVRAGGLSIVTQPSHGTLTGDGPTWTYTPAANYNGDDTVVVRLQDSRGSQLATVTITVIGIDDPPVANPDSFAIGFAAPLTVAHATLLANDTDIDSTRLTVIGVGSATHGVPVISGTSVVFTPDTGYAGAASFVYIISDGTLSATATVSVSIGQDEPPVATDDDASTDEDIALSIQDSALLTNDTDPEVQTLAISAVGGATHGTVSHDGTAVTFIPAANYHGPASFTYTVTDGYLTDTATVTIDIASINDPPTAVVDAAITDEDTQLTLSATVLASNDSDVDGDGVTITGVTATAGTHGGVTLSGGTVTYVPAQDYNGPASFTYTLSDGNGGTATGTVSISIAAINDPPTAVADTGNTDEDTPLTVAGSELAGNDGDVDGDDLSVTAVTGTANTHGTVGLSGGVVTYTPDDDYNGPASFAYTVSDGHGGTATGTVSVSVASINDAPVVAASNGAASYTENGAAVAVDPALTVADVDSDELVGATAQISTGCTDPEDVLALVGAPPGITVVGYTPSTCTLVLTGAATPAAYQAALRAVTYADASDAPSSTARVVTFTVDDGAASSNTGSDDRAVAVNPVDDAPVAVDDSASVLEDAAATAVDVLTNDTDVDGGPRTIIAVTQPARGTVVIAGGGTGLTYTPNANYCNRMPVSLALGIAPNAPLFDTFTYTLSPGGAVGTVSMTVTCVDDAPIAIDDVLTVAEDSGGNTLSVLTNDFDTDGGPISIASISTPANGTASISGDGQSITYAPSAGYCNQVPNVPPDSLTYTLAPGGDTGTVSLTVSCTCGQNKTTDFVVGSN